MKLVKLVATAAVVLMPFAAIADEMPVGDAEAGEKVFKKCRACHVADEDVKKIGPSLMGVIGRQAGTWGEFNYSSAMREAGEGGLVWTPETLYEYLVKPREYIKGTRMAFPGLRRDQQRADVIAYLAQFSDPWPPEEDGEAAEGAAAEEEGAAMEEDGTAEGGEAASSD